MIEINNSLKDDLRAYYAKTDACIDEAEKARVVSLVSKAASARAAQEPGASVPFWRFVAGQLRFVNPFAWVAQIALIALMLLIVGAFEGRESSALAVMATAVVSVAIATPSMFKSFETNVAELEASCPRNSEQVLVSRLVLFGIADVLWMSLAVCLVPAIAGGDPFRIFLYAATPFFAFCALSFYVSRVTNGRGSRACIAAAACVVAAIWWSGEVFPHWYSDASVVVWSVALIAALALAAYEMHKLIAQVASNSVPRLAHSARF